MATVGAVTEAAIGSDGKSGYGFEVTTDDGPFSLTYENEQDARRATDIEQDILRVCRRCLPRHKVPVKLHFVPLLSVAETGKLARHNTNA